MTVNNDSRLLLFLGGERAIVIDIENVQNFLVRQIFAVILENFDVGAGRIVFAQARGELDAAVHLIVVTKKAAKETDHDIGRRVRIRIIRNGVYRRLLGRGDIEQKEESEDRARNSESQHGDTGMVSKV